MVANAFSVSPISSFSKVARFFVTRAKDFISLVPIFKESILTVHGQAAYYSWMSTCTAAELFGSQNDKTYPTFKCLTFACPVDVYVYDSGGNLVASVVNEEIVVDTLAVYVEDGVKVIDLPDGQEYSVRVVAREGGQMDYTVEEMTVGEGAQRTVLFDDVSLNAGDTFTGKVKEAEKIPVREYDLTRNGTQVIAATSDTMGPVTVQPNYNQGGSSGGGSGSSGSSTRTSYLIKYPKTEHGSVSGKRTAFRNDTVTITPVPDSGYTLSTITVSNSKDETIELTEQSDGTYTFTMPKENVTVSVAFAPQTAQNDTENPFLDVKEGPFYNAILWSYRNGVTAGMTPTLFAPDETCTRAQTVTFLWRAAGSPVPSVSENPFTDISPTEYFYNPVLWAMEKNITNGTTKTTFSPYERVRRGQVVTFLYRWNLSGGGGLSAYVPWQNPFTDIRPGLNNYFYAPVRWAVENGVTNGITPTIFAPNEYCTRGQIVTFLYRYKGNKSSPVS